jgi:hypothetical protein
VDDQNLAPFADRDAVVAVGDDKVRQDRAGQRETILPA